MNRVIWICLCTVFLPAVLFANLTSNAYGLEDGIRIVDAIGRQVVIAEPPGRIACMYAFSGHVVAMLGRADDIVAVSNGLKRDVLLNAMYPSIGRALRPKTQGTINIEELARAKPDIVFVDGATGRNHAEAAKLDSCRLTWIAVDFRSMDRQQQAIDIIGRAIGASAFSDRYVAYYQRCIKKVKAAVAGMPVGNRVRVYHAVKEPTRTSLPGSLSADWIAAAGAINVAGQEPAGLLDGRHRVSIEQIMLWHPDVILANEPGTADLLYSSRRWMQVAAVKAERVLQMPIGISRWGHPGSLETPLALLWLGKMIYPDRYTDISIEDETRRFYRVFFGYSLTDDMVKHVLQGRGMRLTKSRKSKQF